MLPRALATSRSSPSLETRVVVSLIPLIHLVLEMGVSKNRGTPKSFTLIGFSNINHPFWGTPIFGNIHIENGLGCHSMGLVRFCFLDRDFFRGMIRENAHEISILFIECLIAFINTVMVSKRTSIEYNMFETEIVSIQTNSKSN